MLIGACSDNPSNINASNVTQQSQSADLSEPNMGEFYNTVMISAPFMPSDQTSKSLGCDILIDAGDTGKYKTSMQADYTNKGWEERINHIPDFFSPNADAGKILVIDFADHQGEVAYRYLSNDNTHSQVYEPWSSSKIFAFTGAISAMREKGLGAQAKIGDTYVADMITGINSYENFGTASGESNALATFFANVAGRDALTSLFYDDWLKLSNPNIFFRGAYGPVAFAPSDYEWQMLDKSASTRISPYLNAPDDPGYLPYRCENCDLTGNKPMTTLAQAEWLKRLAVHNRDTNTRHPNLTHDDIMTLFYGVGHSFDDGRFAGMTLGISTMLQRAIANAIANKEVDDPKAFLDELTKGQWRVFQKIGWGPSETRSTTENVVLAHVCLPHFDGGREFTVAAQVAVAEAKEENLGFAGQKMQDLLQTSLSQYFHE